MDLSAVSEELALIDGQVSDILRALSNGFQKLDKIKDPNRQSRQLEELTDKMRECKRLIKDFEREAKEEESRNTSDVNKMIQDRKQSMIKELNSYVALKKQYASSLQSRVDLFDAPGGGNGFGEENVLLASSMTNQQLMDTGSRMMDETDQAIENSKRVNFIFMSLNHLGLRLGLTHPGEETRGRLQLTLKGCGRHYQCWSRDGSCSQGTDSTNE